MSNETNIEAPEASVVAEDATTKSIVNTDGTFAETWKESLSEDIRGEVCLNTVRDVPGMAKQLVHAQRMIGKDKMAIPTETSTEDEWEAYYKAGGKPETAGDYNLVAPKDYPPELFNKELAGKAQDLFHKIGLSKKQANALLEFNLNTTLGMHQDITNAAELQQQETIEGLHKDWGAAYEQKVHMGNVAIEEGTGGDSEFIARITGKYGNDPDFIRFSANLGSKFAEASGAPQTIPTPVDLQDQINEEMAKPSYTIVGPGHDAQVAKVQRLFAQKSPGMK